MTESEHFKTVGENVSDFGTVERRNLISLMLAALVYLGLYLTTGYAMDTLPAIGSERARETVRLDVHFGVLIRRFRHGLFWKAGWHMICERPPLGKSILDVDSEQE